MEAESSSGLAARADRDLLRAFADRADGAAFAELVTRHGPLVLGACRQVLDRAAAAERLGVPVGTLSSRLSRAKAALRSRLVRRGIALSLAGVGLILTQAATAAVPPPPPLVAATATAATAFLRGAGTGA